MILLITSVKNGGITRSLTFCVIANDLVITAASGADIKINQPLFGGNQWLLKPINRY
ncbi:hypothetical protein [Yersinia pseudotuberculosis]|uniref:hypothetical protein n=1 Tax=Yersinia pseudotuberculosis TaxID=633 RepID=UPI00069A11F3|nr:hypothetical protein [Yersinia pseudotuberculosis]